MSANCEWCVNYCWDEEYQAYCCAVDLDEDEMLRFLQGSNCACAWFQMGDEYKIVQKQN